MLRYFGFESTSYAVSIERYNQVLLKPLPSVLFILLNLGLAPRGPVAPDEQNSQKYKGKIQYAQNRNTGLDERTVLKAEKPVSEEVPLGLHKVQYQLSANVRGPGSLAP